MKTDFVKVDNFYLSNEYLRAETPSRQAGVDEETENKQRLYACEVIQTCGICLKFPQAVMSTGQVLLHRFYCKRSMTEYDVKVVSLTCLWLAAKLEEVEGLDFNMWKVLIVFDRVTRRKDNKSLKLLELFSKKYYKMRDEVVRVERDLLVAFGYVMHVEHPHKAVVSYLSVMSREREGNPPMTEDDHAKVKELMQTAFNYVNDSLRTSLCVRYKADVVACGAIFLAARKLRLPLPEGPDGNWWDLFDVTLSEMSEVCAEILGLYAMPRSFYTPLTSSASNKPPRPAAAAAAAAAPGGATPERTAAPPAACADPFDTPPGSMRSTESGSVCAAPRRATTPLGKAAAQQQQQPPASSLPPRPTPPKAPQPNKPDAEGGTAQGAAAAAAAPGPRDRPPEREKAHQQERQRDRDTESRDRDRRGEQRDTESRDRDRDRERDRDRDRSRGGAAQGERSSRASAPGNGDRSRDRDRERDTRDRDRRRDRDREAQHASSRGRGGGGGGGGGRPGEPGRGGGGGGGGRSPPPSSSDCHRRHKRDGEPQRGRSPKRPR